MDYGDGDDGGGDDDGGNNSVGFGLWTEAFVFVWRGRAYPTQRNNEILWVRFCMEMT